MKPFLCPVCNLIKLNTVQEKIYFNNSKFEHNDVCLLCCNILISKFYLHIIDLIKNKIAEQQFEVSSYKLNLSLPKTFVENENIVYEHIYKEYDKTFNENDDGGKGYLHYTVKDIWKMIMIKELNSSFQTSASKSQIPLFDKDSDFSITVIYSTSSFMTLNKYTSSLEECLAKAEGLDNTYVARLASVKNLDLKWSIKVELKREPIYLAGRYIKLSRTLSQTPWIVRGRTRKLELSVEEIIKMPIALALTADLITFSASGREDVDVRCLGRGRPFALQIVNLKKDPSIIDWNKILNEAMESIASFKFAQVHTTETQRHTLNTNTSQMFNPGSVVIVRDLQRVSPLDVAKYLKQGETSKSKSYKALCYSPFPLDIDQPFIEPYELNIHLEKCLALKLSQQVTYNPSNAQTLNKPIIFTCETVNGRCSSPIVKKACFDNSNMETPEPCIVLKQKTPIRVLHRRSLLNRLRSIYEIGIKFLDSNYFILDITCQAGLYVKEFVHGDFGRTYPSLTSILETPIYLVELDVTEIHLDWPFPLEDNLTTDS